MRHLVKIAEMIDPLTGTNEISNIAMYVWMIAMDEVGIKILPPVREVAKLMAEVFGEEAAKSTSVVAYHRRKTEASGLVLLGSMKAGSSSVSHFMPSPQFMDEMKYVEDVRGMIEVVKRSIREQWGITSNESTYR